MARPPKYGQKMEAVHIRLLRTTIQKLERIARRERCEMPDILRRAVTDYLIKTETTSGRASEPASR